MNCKKCIVYSVILSFAILPICHAGTGRTAAQFLSLSNNARADAMGKAFVTMSGDVGCVFYNPAGLGAMEEAQAMGSYMDYAALFGEASEGMYVFSLAAGTPIDLGLTDLPLGVIATGLLVQDQGTMVITTDSPEPVGEEDLGKNWAMTVSYANKLSNLSAGLSCKLIQQKLWKESDNAFAADFGIQYDLLRYLYRRDLAQASDPSLGLRVGASLQNLGTKIQMRDEYQAQPLPRELTFGASINACIRLRELLPDINAPIGFALLRLHLSGELTAYIDKLTETEEDRRNPMFDKEKAGVGIYAFSSDNMTKKIGSEIWFFDALAIRLGYINIPNMNGDKLVYGLGLRLPISHLAALLTGGKPEFDVFNRLYGETDRQIFLELDLAVNQGIDVPGGSRPLSITFKAGI